MFTRVLKGHIGVASRVFPQGTAGALLDSYAREHLWAIGKDYIHGERDNMIWRICLLL